MVDTDLEETGEEPDCRPEVMTLETGLPLEIRSLPKFDKGFRLSVREARLLQDPPWVRSLGKLNLEVATDGWRFPEVRDSAPPPAERPGPKSPAAPAVPNAQFVQAAFAPAVP